MHPEICQFPSLHFYDSKLINGEQMSNKLASLHEIEFVVGRIGIITPYKAERLILSTVRAADSSSSMNGLSSRSIGFVADVRRMNDALTRAKLLLWILGNTRILQTNQNWAALVKDAKERNLVISAKQPYESLFETAPRGAYKRESINNHSRLSRHAENSRGSGKLGK
ncbi:hypothetical protein SADUNF_Sadunf16G0087400 [Salix dunnii]|uniref:DNA2/NAM7 helicase-like C-terminal domain-containing protein n=1 Tax=Salix dunnii TaxID=1413687 RepID=A0A835JA07_9ROSI|nr:hypothetical protein SADUNF_Sadunf16G0087400 [Salix dunnii]